jgi:hypothetical protein
MGERIWASFSPLEQWGVQYAICNSVFFKNYTLNWRNRKSTWDYTTNHSAGVFCQSVNWCRSNEKRDTAVNNSNIMLTTVLRTLGKYLLLFWKQSLKFCSNRQVTDVVHCQKYIKLAEPTPLFWWIGMLLVRDKLFPLSSHFSIIWEWSVSSSDSTSYFLLATRR